MSLEAYTFVASRPPSQPASISRFISQVCTVRVGGPFHRTVEPYQQTVVIWDGVCAQIHT